MTWHEFATYGVGVLLLVGAFFSIVGCFGLVRLSDAMNRVHAPTKVGTMGVGAMLFGSMVYSFLYGEGSVNELLVMGFLFVTAPVSANFISKVNIHLDTSKSLPAAPEGEQWSTYLDPADQPEAQD